MRTSEGTRTAYEGEAGADHGSRPHAARMPVIPDDQVGIHWAPAGARLYLNFNGGTAGATAALDMRVIVLPERRASTAR